MNNKGFSLIEMVMVIVLVSIIAGFTAAALLEGTEGWLTVAPRKDAMSEARRAMERMVREIREGRRYNYTLSSSQLTFRQYTSKFDASPRVITYQYNAGERQIERVEGATNALAGDVTFMSFSTLKPNLVRIAIRVSESDKTVELKDRAFFRNYTRAE